MAQSAFQFASLPDEVEVLFRCDDDDTASSMELLQMIRPLPHIEIIRGHHSREKIIRISDEKDVDLLRKGF